MLVTSQPPPYLPPSYSTVIENCHAQISDSKISENFCTDDSKLQNEATADDFTSLQNEVLKELPEEYSVIINGDVVSFTNDCDEPPQYPSLDDSPEPITEPVVYTDTLWHKITYGMGVRIGDRLVYDFEKISKKMWETTGLHPDIKQEIPRDLSDKGITKEQWFEWITELEEIQKISPSTCGCMFTYCFPGLLFQAILCTILCPFSYNHPLSHLPCCNGDWYEALRDWMTKVNGTLEQNGMYAKLLTYKPFHTAPISKLYFERIRDKDHAYEMSFLAIALTTEESNILKNESWDHGVNDGSCSGNGRCL